MARRLRLLALSLTFLSAGVGIAAAQSPPDLKGTWSGTSRAIVAGLAPQQPPGATIRFAGPNRLTDVKFTSKIEGQEGSRIWGTISSPTAVYPFIGVILYDGKGIRIVQQHGGILDGTIVDPDRIEVVFIEQTGSVAVASTNTWTRQK